MSSLLKIRSDCYLCANLVGTDVEHVMCKAHQNPTCYRIKGKCIQHGITDVNGENIPVAFVDGYYDQDLCSYSAYFQNGKGIWVRSGCVDRKKFPAYAVGEMYATYLVCSEAINRKCKRIRIFHHLSSTSLIAKGVWKPKKAETKRYFSLISKCMNDIDVEFVLVTSDDAFGDEVDNLLHVTLKNAKNALYKYKNPRLNAEFQEKDVSGLPKSSCGNNVNAECLEAIRGFYEKEQRSFEDYAALKTYGKDIYSNYTVNELQQYVNEHNGLAEKLQQLIGNTKEYENAVRWMLRGLLPADAIRKAKADSFLSVQKYEGHDSKS